MSGNAGLDPPSGDSKKADDAREAAAPGLGPEPQPADKPPAAGPPSDGSKDGAANIQGQTRQGNVQGQAGSNNTQALRDVIHAEGSVYQAARDIIKIHFAPGARATPPPSFPPWQGPASLLGSPSISLAGHLVRAKEQLERRRFAVIQAELVATAEDLLLHIARAMQIADRILAVHYPKEQFGGKNEYATIGLETFLADLAAAEAEAPSLVVLNLSDLPGRDGVSIRQELARLNREESHRRITRFLEEKKLYCAFICGRGSELAQTFGDDGELTCVSLDEEERFLVEVAVSQARDESRRFAQDFQEQIDDGYWGKDKAKRLQHLFEAIRDGDIVRSVNENKDASLSDATKKYSERLELYLRLSHGPNPSDLADLYKERGWSLNQGEQLVAHALFILTHFEDVTARDFDRLMRRLLAGKSTVEVEEVFEIDGSGDAANASPHGSGAAPGRQRIRKVPTEVPLERAIAFRTDHVLALLDVRRQRGGRLGFVPAFKAKIANDVLRLRLPVLADSLLADDTIERAILFEDGPDIAEKLAKAYADHIRQLPETSRDGCLHEWMADSAHHFIEKRCRVENMPDAPEGLRALVDALVRNRLSREYAEGMGLLLSELLKDAETRPLVTSVLDTLMHEGQFTQGKFEIIMHFIRQLRRQEGFNTLHWLKRLLSEGDDEAKRSALKFLTNAVEAEGREGGVGADGSVLTTLRAWLPDRLEEATGLNNQTAALLAPRLALHQALSRLKDKDHGHVTRLEPLIDMATDDGMSRDADVAIDLLAFPTTGAWSGDDLPTYELASLERLVNARWHVELADWQEHDWRRLALVALLTEVIAAVTRDGSDCEPKRKSAVRAVLLKLVDRWPKENRDDIDAMSRIAYDFFEVLNNQHDDAAYRRGRCAKMLGDELYDLCRGTASAQ